MNLLIVTYSGRDDSNDDSEGDGALRPATDKERSRITVHVQVLYR